MFNDKYIEWNQKRIKAIIDFYGYKFFFLKRLLDLGCGHADISGALYRLGADITVVEARQNHLQMVKKKFPQIKTVQADLDAVWPFNGKSFDIVLHLGLLCHLDNYEEQIKRACASGTHLILETTVCDSDDPHKCVKVNENKGQYDMSFNGVGSRPTAAAIERVLQENGMNFRRMDNAKLNSGPYVYDWFPQNRGECDFYKRRLWFCVKGNSPIQFAKKIEEIPAPVVGFNPTALQDSNIHISHRPLVLTKSPTVPHQQKIINAEIPAFPQGLANTKSKIRLFVNYYEDQDGSRKSEIDHSLMNNLDNSLIDVVVLHSEGNPTFDYFFEKINLISSDDDINIIANADISFDNSIRIANNIQPGQVFVLSRWDMNGPRSFSMPDSQGAHQDAWIIRGKVKGVNGNFHMGKPGCDGRLAYEFQQAGYSVLNPALSIKALHFHNSGVRRYTEQERVIGPYLNVPLVAIQSG